MQSKDMAAFMSCEVAQLGLMVGMVEDDMVGYISEGYLHAGPGVSKIKALLAELEPLACQVGCVLQ